MTLDIHLQGSLYLLSVICSVVLYVRRWRSLLRGSLVLLFVGAPLLYDFYFWLQLEIYGGYDHGTAGEFLEAAGCLFCWGLLVVALSVILVRREPAISLVIPVIYSLTAILLIIQVMMEFQGRWDNYHDFYYYSQIYNH